MRNKKIFTTGFIILVFLKSLLGGILDIGNVSYYPPFYTIVSFQRFGTVMYIASTGGILKYNLSTEKKNFIMSPREDFHPVLIEGFYIHPYYPLNVILTRNYIYFYYPKMDVYKKYRHIEGHYVKDIDKIGFSFYKTYIKFKDGAVVSRLNSELPWHKDTVLESNIEWFPKDFSLSDTFISNVSVVYEDGPYVWYGTYDKGVFYINDVHGNLISHIRMGPLSVKNFTLFKRGDTVYVGGNRVKSLAKMVFSDSVWWEYVSSNEKMVYDIYGFSECEDTLYFYGYHKVWAYHNGRVNSVYEDTTANILFYDRKNRIVFTDKYFMKGDDTLMTFKNRVRVCSFYNDTLLFTIKDTLYIWGNGDLWKFDLFDLQRVYNVYADSLYMIIAEDAHVFLINKKEVKVYEWDYISPARVTSIIKKGNYIFFSTVGDGLLVLDTEKNKWEKYREEDGLVSDFIYSMVEINNGLLLSVQSGLVFIPFKEVL